MKNKKAIFFSFVVGMLLLCGAGYLIYRIAVVTINHIHKVNINILVPVLAGAFTITGFFITRYLERRKIIEQQIREQKIPIYQEFLGFIFKVFQGVKKDINDQVSEKEMASFFWTLNQKSILWLSDSTLSSYIKWKNGLVEVTGNEMDEKEKGLRMLLDFEKLLLDFRKDIGHKNKDIKKGDLLSLFVNDWKEWAESESSEPA